MALTTKITARVLAYLSGTADHGAPRADLDLKSDITLTNGTAANQADRVFSDQRTLVASTTEDLDLAGALLDPIGGTTTMARVKAIMVKAAAGNTNNVVIGGAASNAFVGPFGAAAQTIAIPPGGLALLVAPGATGWAVTAGTSDLLRIGNSGAGTPVTYDIIVIGASA